MPVRGELRMAALTGKVAWVTGAGTGIGQAGAVALAEAGAHVVLSGRRAELLAETEAEITGRGGGAKVEPLDVTDTEAVMAVVERIDKAHGRLDILVASAGINVPKRHWGDVSTEDFDRVMDINLNGATHCIAAVLPIMRRQRDGLVINISSWAGRFVSYLTGPAYNASKHALVALTHSLNIEECVNGIRACVICPAEVATPIMKARPIPPSDEDIARMLRPEDLGETIRFVAEMPPHVCVNEILISPTWNRIVLGGAELKRDIPA
jgi:NADP-dependent 3-hydroxy acid dehydrogenase YdfG